MFVRNRQALFFTFFTPLLIIVIFGVIGFNNAPKIDVGIAVQGSMTSQNQQFINQLRNIPVFKIHIGSEKTERKALDDGNRSIVIIPTGPGSINILRNVGDAQSQTAISVLNQIFDKATIAQAQANPVVNVTVQDINVHNLKYIDFLLPGLVAMSIMQLSVFSVAFVFVEYKEKGILKRVVATPVKAYQFVIANIITRLIVALIQAAFFILVGVLFFHVTIVGSYWLIALTALLGAIMFLGLGFTVSGLSKTTESVPAIANLVVFPMLFLGGVFFSIDSMPTWLQYISKILPLTYFSTALRDVMNKGASFGDISYSLAWILGWAIILVLLAVFTFKFEDRR